MKGLHLNMLVQLKKVLNNKFFQYIYQSDLYLSIALNILFLFLAIIFCDFKYEVSDDFIMASIMSGAFGDKPNPQMIFVNVIIGYLLLPLYKLLPQISWYFIAQLSLVFLSSTSATWVLMKKLERPKASMLSIMLILFFTNDAYILMQFTKTAMFAVMAGSLVFIWEIFRERRLFPLLLGGIICLLGTMVRFDVIYMAGPFLILIIVYESLCKYKKILYKSSKTDLKKFVRYYVSIALAGGGLILIAFGLEWVDWYTYNNDEAYGYFYAYSSARSKIVDYQYQEYQTYADEFEKLKISENDYEMLKTWGFADYDYFTVDKVQKIGEIIENEYKTKTTTFLKLLNDIQNRGLQKYPICIVCFLILILGVFFNHSKWWYSLASAFVGGGLLAYFIFRERSIYRIEYCVFLGVFLCAIFFWERESIHFNSLKQLSRFCIPITFLCILGNLLIYIPDSTYLSITSETRKDFVEKKLYYSWDYISGKNRQVMNKNKPENRLLAEFDSNPDKYYFLDFTTTIQTLYLDFAPWQALPSGYFSNFSYLSGVTSGFPDVMEHLAQKGLQNPLKSLVEEHVYLVDNRNLELKLNYIREHYYPNAIAELYKNIDGYQIWKLYKE